MYEVVGFLFMLLLQEGKKSNFAAAQGFVLFQSFVQPGLACLRNQVCFPPETIREFVP